MCRKKIIQCETTELVQVSELPDSGRVSLRISDPTRPPMSVDLTPDEAKRLAEALNWAAGQPGDFPGHGRSGIRIEPLRPG